MMKSEITNRECRSGKLSPATAPWISSFVRHSNFVIHLCLLALLVWVSGFAGENALSQPASTNSAVLPLEFHREHVMVRVSVNKSQPLLFMLDTGYSMNMISPEQASALQLRRAGRVTIIGVAGEEPADMFEGPTFDFGHGFTYTSRRIAVLPSNSWRFVRRDGILGSGFYRRFVLEFDHRAKSLTIRDPTGFQYSGAGEIVPLRFPETTPVIRASILFSNEPPIEAEFAVDTGCDGGLCLGHDFVERHKLEERSLRSGSSRRNGVGGGTRTQVARLPKLQIGRTVIEKPTANFFEQGSPVDPPLAGHIGMEILRQFRVIFDYTRKQMVLER
jgi:aspartyl protease